MRAILTFMAMGAVATGLVLALIYFWQSSLILLPGTGGSSTDLLTQCAPGSAAWIANGKYLGKICEPTGTAKGTIIIYHGNAGTVDDRAFLAGVLTRRGYRAVLVEYPGFGKREGHATIRNVLATSLRDFEIAHAAWPAPVYVLGESFGAGIAAEVAEKHRNEVSGVVLITPWDSLANVVDSMFLVPLSLMLHERFDTVKSLAAYRGNIVIVAAEQDEVLPVRHARALAKATAAAAYLELPGTGHNNWPSFMSQQDWDWVIESLAGSTPKLSQSGLPTSE